MHAYKAVLALLSGAGLTTACVDDDPLPSRDAELGGSSVLAEQLARVRAATARYHDVATAEADGFLPTDRCVFDPVRGTMGLHFAHPARLGDPAVAIEEPEVLLYLPHNGQLRLVAVEYVHLFLIDGAPYLGCGAENNSCPPSDPPPAPDLYEGIAFNGPMAGHEPGMPWHYDLHAWIWAHNPTGLFSQYNPALSCE